MMFGRIHSVDASAGVCRVESGGNTTDSIRWIAMRAGSARSWRVPSVGEQVLLLCPGGDTTGAVALCGIYCDAFPPPSQDPDVEVTEYPDGTRVEYNHDTSELTISMAAGGVAQITASRVKVTADVEIDGNLSATGTVTGETDVIGGGKSLKQHKHTGVDTGGGVSGPPQ